MLYEHYPIYVRHSETEGRDHLMNVTDVAGCDFLPDGVVHGEAAAPHSLHQEQFLTSRIIDQFGSLFQVHCQRLLAQNVLAMLQHQHRDIEMLRMDRTDVYNVLKKKKKTVNIHV